MELVDDSLDQLARVAEAHPDRLLAPLVIRPGGRREDSVHPDPLSPAAAAFALVPPALLPSRVAAALAPWRSASPRPVGWAVGGCLVASTETLRRLGPFDPDIFMYAEDLDLGLRARDAGVQTWFWPGARVIHHGAHSTRRAFGGEAFDRLARQRFGVVQRRRGRRAARADTALQLATFADRALIKRLAGRSAARERRLMTAAWRAAREARP